MSSGSWGLTCDPLCHTCIIQPSVTVCWVRHCLVKHDVMWPQGTSNLKLSSEAPPGSSDGKLIFCHQAGRCTHGYLGHAWHMQQGSHLSAKASSAAKLGEPQSSKGDCFGSGIPRVVGEKWLYHCENVVVVLSVPAQFLPHVWRGKVFPQSQIWTGGRSEATKNINSYSSSHLWR